ncbi:MAG: hypothetical protein HY365_01910 [Candidatus Aenigmarchaeota archaeon]|nr:hypothetical protein [Candidatus Aenigmarchaeota archaeon]
MTGLRSSHSLAIANIVHLAQQLGYEVELEHRILTTWPNGEKYRGRIDIALHEKGSLKALIEVERPTFINPEVSKSAGTPNPSGYLRSKPSFDNSKIKLNAAGGSTIKIIISTPNANDLSVNGLKEILDTTSDEIIIID